MTHSRKVKKKTTTKIPFIPILCLCLASIMLALGNELRAAILSGMSLAALRIVPTLFPFMVLSDLWMATSDLSSQGTAAKCFSRIFKINGCALSALMCGIFAGFPLGVKSAAALYRSGLISKDELERLAPVVNLPSPAFVISGIGLGILGDVGLGVLLYLCVIFSSTVAGFVSGLKKDKSRNTGDILGQSFSLADSVMDAAFSSLVIAGYITFFSGVLGLISVFLKDALSLAVISCFLEVGNSAIFVGNLSNASPIAVLTLLAFSLGFSGFSVHLQAFSFLPKEVSRIKYLLQKLIIGLLSALLIMVFYPLFYELI